MKTAQGAEIERGGYRGNLTIGASQTGNGSRDTGSDLRCRTFIADRGEPADPKATARPDVRSLWELLRYGSRGSGPASTPCKSRMSRMVRANGPITWKSIQVAGNPYRRAIRPVEGRMPTRPVYEAGSRVLPPMSVPIASGVTPAATDAEAPPEDPPGVRAGSHGLRVMPDNRLSVRPNMASSGVVVLPTMTAPAARSRSTQMSSRSGMKSRNSRLPHRACGRYDEDVVLDRHGDPVQRAQFGAGGLACGGGLGRGRRAIAVHVGEGIQHRLQRIEPRERLIEQLDRRDVARIQQR